ncbi:MAG: riboflavin synthase [Pseudomonadales bacterium]
MFTGIIQTLGSIDRIDHKQGDVCLVVGTGELDTQAIKLGDSIAVNGVCLTVTDYDNTTFSADVSIETLDNTTLGGLSIGSSVNLEKAVLPSEPLGGHIVSGHVDGVGSVRQMKDDGRSTRYQFAVPENLSRYIAKKGSVTIDGVSLTVNEVEGNEFSVNIIPHTQKETIFHCYQVATTVNIEVDVVARYVERLLQFKSADGPSLSYATLADNGFAP